MIWPACTDWPEPTAIEDMWDDMGSCRRGLGHMVAGPVAQVAGEEHDAGLTARIGVPYARSPGRCGTSTTSRLAEVGADHRAGDRDTA